MSDEEFIIDENADHFEDDGEDGGDGGDDGMMDDDMNNDESENKKPKELYEEAKDNISLYPDSEVIELFLNVYEKVKNDEDELNIKTKSISRALILLAQNDDNDKTAEVLTEFFDLYNKKQFSDKRFNGRFQEILTNSLHNENTYTTVLSIASKNVDINKNMNLFLDLKLREVEQVLSTGNDVEAKKIIEDTKQYIPLPPNQEDVQMCRIASKLLSIEMEIALNDGRFKDAMEYHSIISEIPQVVTPTLRISGINKTTEGLKLFESGKYLAAKDMLFDAFKDMNSVGNNMRIAALQFFTLALMMTHEKSVNIYNNPELNAFKSHPRVAPFSQLYDAYMRNDYNEFKKKMPTVTCDLQSKFYVERVNDIRRFVLKCSINNFVKPYARLEIGFIAKSLECDENEVRDAIFTLIYENPLQDSQNQFKMKFDTKNDTIIRAKKYEVDNILQNSIQLIDYLNNVANSYVTRFEL